MGIESSKPQKSKIKTVDFPRKNYVDRSVPEIVSPRDGSRRQPPGLPARTTSLQRPAAHYDERSPYGPQLSKEKSVRSCLSWEKNQQEVSRVGSVGRATPQPTSGKVPKGTCDKCDGAHLTDDCPIYKKKRDDHPDAWRNFGRKSPLEMGKGGGNFRLRSARVIHQPGDGSCLFHSLAYGLGSTSATLLRRDIAAFVQRNADLEIADTPMRDWIKWDSGLSVANYASRMAVSGWGGGIEMAACSHLKNRLNLDYFQRLKVSLNQVNVHVYEKERWGGGYKRISCFDVDNARRTIHVLYQGGVHFDALQPAS